ncbi:hypothetical protein LTSEMIN_2032 [Salmonella enterica subsp. enterica serovar Minnesota str. A4-603]|nr:hypothetical protein LTSEMIN_2032 [Salmonella enterica subsp. enterica serovar Minnesota str. A4-603]
MLMIIIIAAAAHRQRRINDNNYHSIEKKAIFRPQKSGNKKTEMGFCNMTLCPGSALPVNPGEVAECAY